MRTPYERRSCYSRRILGKLRHSLCKASIEDDAVVLTCGSYARHEATEDSDIDFFVISSGEGDDPDLKECIASVIRSIVPNEPSRDGAFGEILARDQLLKNIGGKEDDNKNITRRILFLLECEWLYNEEGLRDFRHQILERYISEEVADHRVALFLLNDIIRYYRTVAVDYEFKTVEQENPKPWAIRNIKLVFSRKLLYTSGLFSVAMTADRSRNEKIKILETLFGMPVIERMTYICGERNMEPVLNRYNDFLGHLEIHDRRKHLIELASGKRQDEEFRKIKNEGHQFTRELLKLLENTFDSTHPIHRAILFLITYQAHPAQK